MKLIAVLNDRSGATADCPAGLNGSTSCRRSKSIENGEAADMEQQHGDGIAEPALLPLLVDAAGAVKNRFDRHADGRQEGALAIEDARHVGAEHGRQRDDDGAIKDDLNPAEKCHGVLSQNRSGRSSATVR